MDLTILHVDMDAFYASVEQMDNPALKGKPVIVGGSAENRGVVSAASYEARTFGVRSAMPTAEARRLCPRGIFVSGRMSRYVEISHDIRNIFHRYTPMVEPVSLDEAYLDVSGSRRLFGDAVEIGRRIKSEIRTEVGLTASVGVAPNRFLAKLASDHDKPDGFTVIHPENVLGFLAPMTVEKIHGVGPAAVKQLHRWGIRTVEQLQQLSEDQLKSRFGDWGSGLYALSRGIDNTPVSPERAAKSISAETTFSKDVSKPEVLRSTLYHLSEKVGRRLRKQGLSGKTVVLKVRWPTFKLISRNRTLPCPTDLDEDIYETAWKLAIECGATERPVRLIGVGVQTLQKSSEAQDSWLLAPLDTKRRQLNTTLDRLRAKYDNEAVQRGRTLPGREEKESP